MGVLFILVGGFLLLNFSMLLLDPESTITVNGVVTSAFTPKLQAVIFTASFTLIGIVLLFVPKSVLNKLFIWDQSLISTFTLKLKRKSIKLLILLYLIFTTSWFIFAFDKIDIIILLIGTSYCYSLYKKENIS